MNPTFMFLAISLVLIPCASAEHCVVTVIQAPEPVPVVTDYNETTLYTVQHFITHLAPCPWAGSCGVRATYFSAEAEKVGLCIDEVTLRDCDRSRVKRIVKDGHRVNTFTDGDSRYYTTNFYAGDARVVTRSELQTILRELMDGT